MDPILLRGIERILITVGAVIFAYLGYRLFLKGKDSAPSSLEVESDLLKVVVSGQGPGLFFMAFGAIVLMFSILSGGGKVSESGSGLKDSITPDYEKSLLKINEKIASLNPATRKELGDLMEELQKYKEQNEAIYEYVRSTELKIETIPKYSNDELGQMIEKLTNEIDHLNSTMQELTRNSTQTGISAGASTPAG